jgi:hypothetical protein
MISEHVHPCPSFRRPSQISAEFRQQTILNRQKEMRMGVRHAEYLAPVPSAPPPPTPDMAFASVQPTVHTAMHAPRFEQGAPESISGMRVMNQPAIQ